MENFLLTYGYIIFLPLSIIEGPIVTIVGAFLASQGIFNVIVIYILALLGDMIGDVLYYTIGRYGGERLLRRYGRFFGITTENLALVKTRYFTTTKSLWKIITLSKVTQAPSASILLTCGILQVDFRDYVVITFLNNVVKVLVFLLVGFYFGMHYTTIDSYLAKSWLVFIPLVLILAYLLVRARAQQRHSSTDS